MENDELESYAKQLKYYFMNIAQKNAENEFNKRKNENKIFLENLNYDLMEMDLLLAYNWGSFGFDYMQEKENIKDELGLIDISNSDLLDIAMIGFSEYYLDAFLRTYSTLAMNYF